VIKESQVNPVYQVFQVAKDFLDNQVYQVKEVKEVKQVCQEDLPLVKRVIKVKLEFQELLV